ncbi:peroxisome assembly protein 26 [Festucalex cinctus]
MTRPRASDNFTPVFKPPLSCTQSKLLDMLEEATEQLMLYKDFHASFHICNRGLESLARAEDEDVRGELKAAFCIVAIQALAELNRWPGVLAWVLKYYQHQEEIPAQILHMCILLYSKLGDPAAVQQVARAWLGRPSNWRLDGFRAAAELYLLHVLLPLGHTDRARELVAGEVGSAAFNREQRRTALDIIQDEERERNDVPDVDVGCRSSADNSSMRGSLRHQVEALLRLTYRRLMSTCGSFLFHKLLLAALILYVLFLRMDPALPSSFVWISKLHQLLGQMWNVMLPPYYPTWKE